MEKIFYLIYTSTEKQKLPESELDELMFSSRQRNLKLNITGMLVYNKGRFVQYLEGGKNELVKLYEQICNDPRHLDVQVVTRGKLDTRKYNGWSMLLKSLDYSDIQELEKEKRKIMSQQIALEDQSIDDEIKLISTRLIAGYLDLN